MAWDISKDQNTNLANIAFSDNPRKTGNIITKLDIKVGACVMLMTNINVADGLTNGAMGTVTGVVLKQNAIFYMILVKFYHSGMGSDARSHSKYKHISNDSVPIEKMEVTFKPNKKHHVRVLWTQFPLMLWLAVTRMVKHMLHLVMLLCWIVYTLLTIYRIKYVCQKLYIKR